jgi:hypothetical protein
MPTSPEIQAVEKKFGVWITGHHMVLYTLLAGALAFGVYEVEAKIADLATARAEASQQALAVEKDHSDQLLKTFQEAQAQRDKENAAYLQTITQIRAQTQVQIVHDRALPAPELGNRIESLTGFKQGSITLNPSQDLIVPLPVAREIVVRLDQGAADAQTVVQQAGVIANQIKTINDQTGIIAEDKIVLVKQIKADGDELKKVKADARKSMWKHIGIGIGIGFGLAGRVFGKF